ncbi:MAG: FAD-linked oxidase C-terminal domain-containing protein [Pyrinomonadaceae bacterium]
MAAKPELNSQFDPGVIADLRAIVGSAHVLTEPDELLVYECDGLPQHKYPPRAVVFPETTQQVSDTLLLLAGAGISFAPRGAGTGLSGGALAVNRGVVIELARMRRILSVDTENRIAVVQTGLVNAQLSRALAPHGLYYVPDPSSQPACTIGGNIAENAGGIHCLKYGTTTDHVLGARVVLANGEIIELGGGGVEKPGYDLLGVFIGSEGTFGIATEATLKLSPIPPAVRTLLADFTDVNAASRAVSAIIAAGLMPAALEMLDGAIIRAVEASVFAAGLPQDAEAALLIELDGMEAGLDSEAEQVEAICRHHSARNVRRAESENERKKLWAARKGAFGAMGRVSPDTMIQDAVVPRSRLPEVLAETYRIGAKYNLRVANVFHAGDGNLHPFICFDVRKGDDVRHVQQAGREIMETCVRAGGSITGEHGVGLDKSSYLPLIFSEDDMTAMLQVRTAFDPSGLCNPGKIIPTPRGCGEARAVATHNTQSSDTQLPQNAATKAVLANTTFASQAHALHERSRTTTNARVAARVSAQRLFEELVGIVGAQNVEKTSAANRTDISLKPATELGALLVAPGSEAEAAEVMQIAARDLLAVVPAGAQTWLDAGNPLNRADLIISTRRMARVFEHEPADLVATAGAGVSLADFKKQIALAGQSLPLDPPDDGNATLGGVVATGLGGAHSFSQGRPRTFVIGMRIILPDGRLIKAGGKVVKNVAGYDLCKLFTGSYGTLGLITELTFKLRPLPAETRTIIATGSLDSLFSNARSMALSLWAPQAIEIVSPRLAKLLNVGESEHAMLLKFGGSSQAVVNQTAETLTSLRKNSSCSIFGGDEEALWRSLAGVSLRTPGELISRASVLPTRLSLFLAELLQLDQASQPDLMWHAGVADGRVRMIAKPPVYYREAVRALERLRKKAEALGGSLILEKAATEIKAEFDSWGSMGTSFSLMKQVKDQLDPDNLFSPGRFFGGI